MQKYITTRMGVALQEILWFAKKSHVEIIRHFEIISLGIDFAEVTEKLLRNFEKKKKIQIPMKNISYRRPSKNYVHIWAAWSICDMRV